MPARILIGTAGWSIPRASSAPFPEEGSHLQRYSRVLPAVEINSSFYRPHAAATYARWAAATPPSFLFAVKMPKAVTHDQRLRQPRLLTPMVARFLSETAGLGNRRGPLLVQLPPSLEFDARTAGRFFGDLRLVYDGYAVCEPRHPTWFSVRAEALLVQHQIGRVAADPARAPGADLPGGWPGIGYYRLHGFPRMYWSSYPDAYLAELAGAIRRIPPAVDVWVIFDNTTSGAALQNALTLALTDECATLPSSADGTHQHAL